VGAEVAAGRAEIQNETDQAIEKFHLEADEHSRTAHAAAAEALRTELPRWLAPQLEQLTRDLTERLSREGATQRNEHGQQLESMTDALRKAGQYGEYAATRLKTQAEQTQAQIAGQAEAAAKTLEEAAAAARTICHRPARHADRGRQRDSATGKSGARVGGIVLARHLASELQAAQARWQAAIESTLAEAQDRAAGGLNKHARGWMDQLQDEIARHAAAARESAANAALEAEQRLAALRDSLQEQTQRLESVLAVAAETSHRLEQHSAQLETCSNNRSPDSNRNSKMY